MYALVQRGSVLASRRELCWGGLPLRVLMQPPAIRDRANSGDSPRAARRRRGTRDYSNEDGFGH
jgi:hypothetical protein